MARLSAAVRTRAAELRDEHGWSGAYALRQASAEARGLSPQQARGVHPDEPQFLRILGARTQTDLGALAFGAAAVRREVDPSTGDVTYTFTDRKTGREQAVTVNLRASKDAEHRIVAALGPDAKIIGTR